MGGQQRLSRHMAEQVGEEIGADGMEITWHSGARESHEWFAGRQFDMETYRNVIVPLLEEYNCRHRAFSVVLGVSRPLYTPEELDRMNAEEHIKREFEGKGYNKYEATQFQRRLETTIRKTKDASMAHKAAGDKQAETLAKARVTALNQKYAAFSDAMGIPTKGERMAVGGYTRGMSLERFTNGLGGGIINGIDISIRPDVTNSIMDNIIKDIYKGQGGKNIVGNGTTMDAVRNELMTGLPMNGKFHSTKAEELINRLNRRLRAQGISDSEAAIAKALIEDLENALGGK